MPDAAKIAAARLLQDMLTLEHHRVPLWVAELARVRPARREPGEPDPSRIAAAQLLREMLVRDGEAVPQWVHRAASGIS